MLHGPGTCAHYACHPASQQLFRPAAEAAIATVVLSTPPRSMAGGLRRITAKRSTPAATPAKSKRTQEWLLAAKEKRSLASAEKRANNSARDVDLVLQSKEEDLIIKYLRPRPAIRARVVTLITTGLLERTLNHETGPSSSTDKSTLGRRAFPQPDGKWQSLGLNPAKWLLAHLLGGTAVISWFEGDDRLPTAIATATVFLTLGGNRACAILQGHPNGHYENFMKPLCQSRYAALGKRLDGATKDTLKELSQWWRFKAMPTGDNLGVVCAGSPGSCLRMPFAITNATEWRIEDAPDYENGRLISDSLGYDMLPRKLYEKQCTVEVVHNMEFHYLGFAVGGADPEQDPQAPKRRRSIEANVASDDSAAPASVLADVPPRPQVAPQRAFGKGARATLRRRFVAIWAYLLRRRFVHI